MARYTITVEVKDKRKSAFERKLAESFSLEEAEIITVEEEVGPGSRSDRLFDADCKFQDAYNTVATLKEEMQEWLDNYCFDNMPQGSAKPDDIQSCIDALEKMRGEMENIDLFCDVEFPSAF